MCLWPPDCKKPILVCLMKSSSHIPRMLLERKPQRSGGERPHILSILLRWKAWWKRHDDPCFRLYPAGLDTVYIEVPLNGRRAANFTAVLGNPRAEEQMSLWRRQHACSRQCHPKAAESNGWTEFLEEGKILKLLLVQRFMNLKVRTDKTEYDKELDSIIPAG